MKEEISQLKERDTRLKIRCFHKWLTKSIKTAEKSQEFHSDPSFKAAAGGQKTAFKNTCNYLETHFPEYLGDLLTKPPVAFKVTLPPAPCDRATEDIPNVGEGKEWID